ncbi:uncharacterized protein VNE69_05188 [Vairimorpha necatrix]|uniref:Membrane protein n=1 Tax=Vairimorpha necatrix TaxID=6039 RepID=A0AAX4JCA2_9MICR
MDVCIPFTRPIYDNPLSDKNFNIFYEFFWNTITNHEIFLKMTKNDFSKNSFNNRNISLKNKFLKSLRINKLNTDESSKYSNGELLFIEKILFGTEEYYDILRICYKDVINNAVSAIKNIEEIIRQHTCFIPNGASKELPLPVYKICKGLITNINFCYGEDGLSYFHDFIKINHDNLSKAECINSNEDYLTIDIFATKKDNNTETFTNEINNITEFIEEQTDKINALNTSKTNNYFDTISTEETNMTSNLQIWWLTAAVISVCFIILGIMFMFKKYKCWKKKPIERNEVLLTSTS